MTALTERVEARVRAIVPRERVASVVNNIGLPISGINVSYGNSGTIGTFDADMLVSLNEGEPSAAEFTKVLRERLPRDFPGVTFSFLPADIVSQILNFGSPAPLDVQIVGNDLEGNRTYAGLLLARLRHVAGIADPRIQEQARNPALKVDFDRELAGVVGLTEGDAASSIQATLSGSTQTAPTYWLDPSNGVSYPVSVQTPQYSIDTLGDLKNLPVGASRSTQLLGGVAEITPEPLSARWSIGTTSRTRSTSWPPRRVATSAASSPRYRRRSTTRRANLPKGSIATIRGQASTMAAAYGQLLVGLAFSIVLIYLLIVVNFQSWLDPFVIITALPARGSPALCGCCLPRTPMSRFPP